MRISDWSSDVCSSDLHDGRYEGLNDRILSEANKLAISCDATLEVIYAYDLSSITASEYGLGNGSMFFSSTLARQLYESQGEAFDALPDRNGIAPEQIGRASGRERV